MNSRQLRENLCQASINERQLADGTRMGVTRSGDVVLVIPANSVRLNRTDGASSAAVSVPDLPPNYEEVQKMPPSYGDTIRNMEAGATGGAEEAKDRY